MVVTLWVVLMSIGHGSIVRIATRSKQRRISRFGSKQRRVSLSDRLDPVLGPPKKNRNNMKQQPNTQTAKEKHGETHNNHNGWILGEFKAVLVFFWWFHVVLLFFCGQAPGEDLGRRAPNDLRAPRALSTLPRRRFPALHGRAAVKRRGLSY